MENTGKVWLVGAGPGDPELLTLKAQRKLLEADVIVYDRDVTSSILELSRRDAERFAVSTMQFDISTLLARQAQAGKHVVFLISGDVDHGSDEVAVLEQYGFAVDIVPGIASDTAKPFPFMSRDDIASEMLRAAS